LQQKSLKDCWHKNKLFFIKIFKDLILIFAMLSVAIACPTERRCASAVISDLAASFLPHALASL